MSIEILVRYLHFISIFTMVSSIVVELVLVKPKLTRNEIKRLSVVDGVYGLSAVLVVAMGLTLWFGVGKPANFYTNNWIFHSKVGLAILMGILSIYPTVFFMKQRTKKGANGDELVDVPKGIKRTICLELLLVLIIPLMASMMAKGVGFMG